jgi:hypothetical protein
VSAILLNANPNAEVRNPDWCCAKFLCQRRFNQCHSSTHCVWNRLFLLECGTDYSDTSSVAEVVIEVTTDTGNVVTASSGVMIVSSGTVFDAR